METNLAVEREEVQSSFLSASLPAQLRQMLLNVLKELKAFLNGLMPKCMD